MNRATDDGQDGGRIAIRASGPLPPRDAAEVLDLIREAAASDGVSPLSEHVMLHLRYGAEPAARNVLLFQSGALAGYGHLEPADPVEGRSAEMVIRPADRRHGLGRALGRALLAEAGGAPLQLWAHGDLPAAARLAAAVGFRRSRALWQMHRSLQTPLDDPRVPDGVSVRTFRVGRDEDAWLAVNRRAFARHPEQGSWTGTDLELREHEPWFDPAGFFLAERGGRLTGFHWTKVHGGAPAAVLAASADAGPAASQGPEPIGEVYVIGVDPDEQGTGLGRALTLIGLRYLRSRGLTQVMLYVDETNAAAIRLYESLGFAHSATDVMFSAGDEKAGNRD